MTEGKPTKSKRPRKTQTETINDLRAELERAKVQLSGCGLVASVGLSGEGTFPPEPPLKPGDNGHSEAYERVYELVRANRELQTIKEGLDKLLKEKAKEEYESARRRGKTEQRLRHLQRGATIVRDTLTLLLDQAGPLGLLAPWLLGGVGAMALGILGGGLLT